MSACNNSALIFQRINIKYRGLCKGKFSKKIQEEYFTSSTPFTADGVEVIVATLLPCFINMFEHEAV
jgi:hypothetical protein